MTSPRRSVPPGLVLAVLVVVSACDGASGDLLATLPGEEPPSTEHCVARLSSDPVSAELCATPTTWLAVARADCDGLGLALLDETLLTGASCAPDDAGRVRYLQARYDCCLPAGCRIERQGDGLSCLDEGVWRERAEAACTLAGLSLGPLVRREPCADGLSLGAIEYACCAP